MPTIRIDDDVFEGLKSLAEPFTDTPNTVIRRLVAQQLAKQVTTMVAIATGNSGAKPAMAMKSKPSKTKGALTPQPIYEAYLLHVLATNFHGSASKINATKKVIELMTSRGLIADADLAQVSTGETKAENTIAWGRNALKERGLISSTSPKGIWELTSHGMIEAEKANLPTKQSR